MLQHTALSCFYFLAVVPSASSFVTPGLHGTFKGRVIPQTRQRDSWGGLFMETRRDKDGIPELTSNVSTKSPQSEETCSLSVAMVTSLILLGQVVAVAPSEASYAGRFSTSVNPPKAVSCVETNRWLRDEGESSCQPASFINGLKADFLSKRADDDRGSLPANTGKIRTNEQLMEHQKLLDDLAKEPEWFNYASAFFASAVSTLIVHPLDTVKVRLMVEKNGKHTDASDDDDGNISRFDSVPARDVFDTLATDSDGPGETWGTDCVLKSEINLPPSKLSIAPSPPKPALSSSTALSAVAAATANEQLLEPKKLAGLSLANIRSLYNGILPNLFKEAPPSALYLGLYESSMILLKQIPFFADHNLLTYLLAGAIGEMAGSIVRSPAEAVKTRVQTGMDIGSAMKTVFLTPDGRSNTFAAWSSSVFRDVPAGAVQIALFEVLKTIIIASPYNFDVDNLISESILGGIGGAAGAFLTTPSDRVTTMVMSSKEELSAAEGAKMIWSEYGIKGFFIGSTERSIYWFFAIGIFLSVYCATRQAAIPFFL